MPATEGAALWRRSALASTLLAGLELSRDGAVTLEQDAAFQTIWVSPAEAQDMVAAKDAAA